MQQQVSNVKGWQHGYQKFSLKQRIVDLGIEKDFADLKREFQNLPPDDYDGLARRFRSYLRGAFSPGNVRSNGFQMRRPTMVQKQGTSKAITIQST